MNSFRKLSLSLVIGMFLLLASCYDEEVNLNKTAAPSREAPGDYADQPGSGTVVYPSILKQTFIPDYERFAHTKCIAWRIEWPVYGGGMDPDQIPTFFATSKGSLNSFDYLQSVDPANKQKVNFSLYLDSKVEAATNISNLWALGEVLNVQDVRFRKLGLTPSEIEFFATERPSLFEDYWEYAESSVFEADYQEGDFFLYQLLSDQLFGGIRIVSDSPRIIEVYLAVPNI